MRYVIYSIEHQAWWKPAQHGYTKLLAEAGRYEHAEAVAILQDANRVMRDDKPNELMMPVNDEVKPAGRMFWAYLHDNGSVIVKPWFGDVKDYIDDCIGNVFVVQVVEPYRAESREEAEAIAKQRLYLK